MTAIQTKNDYWFTIEPYVFISIKQKSVLLYNTLDGGTIISENDEVIDLLKDTIKKENCGVVLLTNDRYQQKEINKIVNELREKYMGDIIDITLSKGKPIQIFPYFNFPNKPKIYKTHNFSPLKNILQNLAEINIYLGDSLDVRKLIPFLLTIPENRTLSIIGNISEITNYNELLSHLDHYIGPKQILCSYKNIMPLQLALNSNFSYQISVCFPINMQQWENSRLILLNQTYPIEYVFSVTSDEDCIQAEQLVEQFKIKEYHLKPVYTGDNIRFFEENVFLTQEDILSTSMTIKDFFARQAMNIYEFGKINIMPNGDAYANLNHPMLGNIYKDSINEIVYNEVEKGKSWFRVRDQEPCAECVFQWLCPPPSNYEIEIGRLNLCHVKRVCL